MVIHIKLTKMECEVMEVLWKSETPMCVPEIIRVSKERTWRERSIYNILKSMLAKKAIEYIHCTNMSTNTARAVRALISKEEYIAMQMIGPDKDIDVVKVVAVLIGNQKFNAESKAQMSRLIESIKIT